MDVNPDVVWFSDDDEVGGRSSSSSGNVLPILVAMREALLLIGAFNTSR